MRELAQALVERTQPGMHVVEPAAHALLVVGGDDGRNLGRCEPQLLGDRDDLLQRPVVQIEAEAHESPLACRSKVVLAQHSPVEERSPLEDRRKRRRSLGEVFLEMGRLRTLAPSDESRVGPIPPLDDPGVNLG